MSCMRGDYAFDFEELLRLRTICKELRKEKDVLKLSLLEEKSKNADLIQKLDLNANAASEAHLKDKRYIEELERELSNCSQELGYLQDQLNLRNVESNCMGEHVHSLELKLAEVGTLHEKLRLLSEGLVQSDSKRLILLREIKDKEEELHNSSLHIEELESAVASIALESQCEIESIRLDITYLEERCIEAEKLNEQAVQEKSKMNMLLEESESQFHEAHERISCLEMENKALRQKLVEITEGSTCKIAELLKNVLEDDSRLSVYVPGGSIQDLLVAIRKDLPLLKEICTCGDDFCPFLSTPAVVTASDDNAMEEMEKMSNQIHEFKGLVVQLKEELRIEKLKAKEEAEDLTQAMAELRYQMTEMLEEECKRRASIEQASLRRIQDLEEQVRKEQKKSFAAIKRLQEVHELSEMRSMEIRHLKNAVEEFRRTMDPEIFWRIESSSCRDDVISKIEAAVDDETSNDISNVDESHQALIGWYPTDEAPLPEAAG